jgi:flagellar biosynthesis protein FlhB
MSGERTEDPTERRRQQAREKGQGVGRSHELAQVITLVAGLLAMSALLPGAARRLEDLMRSHIQAIGDGPAVSGMTVLGDAGSAFSMVVSIVLPLGAAVALAGTLGNLAGGGFILSGRAIGVQWARLNPTTGMKRLLDKTALQRLGINVAKLVVLSVVSWQVIGSRIPRLVAMDGQTGGTITGLALNAMYELGVTIAILLAAVALADWILQRRQAAQSLRMTKEEVKQETKEQEGDPHVKGQRKARARQLAFARMMDDVARADVIVVNPIRLAVALKYDPGSMRAPRIVGKGQRLIAARIRDIARANRIPIIEDVPLARALFTRPVGSEVPADLYRAVARILVLVARLRNGSARPAARRRPAPAPGRLPTWFGGAPR